MFFNVNAIQIISFDAVVFYLVDILHKLNKFGPMPRDFFKRTYNYLLVNNHNKNNNSCSHVYIREEQTSSSKEKCRSLPESNHESCLIIQICGCLLIVCDVC